MKRSEFEALLGKARIQKEKSTDMDIMIAAISKLPPGQLKKVLTDQVLAVLRKYGDTE